MLHNFYYHSKFYFIATILNISGAHQISKIFPNKLTFAVLSTREFPREKLDIKKFIKGVVVCLYASMYVCVYKHWVVIKSNFGNHPWDYYITSFHTSCIFSTRSSAVYRSILQYEREILNHILVCPQKWTHKNTSNCYYIIFSPTVKVYLRKTLKL